MINDTCLAKYGWSDVQNLTLLSDQELIDYCRLYDAASYHFDGCDRGIAFSMMVTGSLGLINNALMLLTFQKSGTFAGPTFAYHKAMGYAELLHMLIMLQYSVFRYYRSPGDAYGRVLWRDVLYHGWVVGDGCKLFISCITTCVSLERIVAIWFPNQFRRINNRRTALMCVAVSVVISAIHMVPIACHTVLDLGNGHYAVGNSPFGLAGGQLYVNLVVYILKISHIVVISGASMAVAVGVHLRSSRASNLSSVTVTPMSMSASASAPPPPPVTAVVGGKRWTAIRRATGLQLIAAVSLLLDYAGWLSYKLCKDRTGPYLTGRAAVVALTFPDAVMQLDGKRLETALELLQALTAELDHGARLYIYLLFHQSFRTSFRRMFSHSVATSVAPPTI